MSLHEQVLVIGHDFQCRQVPAWLGCLGLDQGLAPVLHRAGEQRRPVPGSPHHLTSPVVHATRRNMPFPAHLHGYARRRYLTRSSRFPRRPKTADPSRGI